MKDLIHQIYRPRMICLLALILIAAFSGGQALADSRQSPLANNEQIAAILGGNQLLLNINFNSTIYLPWTVR